MSKAIDRDTYEQYVETLRMARHKARMTQADVAREIGVGQASVSDWERGHVEPSVPNFIAWCRVLGYGYTPRKREPHEYLV